jgi:hypothetical protein
MRRSSATRSSAFATGRELVDPEHLAERLAHRQPRVQRGERVLEDVLRAATEAAQVAAVHAEDALAVEERVALGRLLHAQERAAGGRLAAPRLAHQPQRLAAAQEERHAVHRLHVAAVRLKEPLPDREVLLQLPHHEERVGGRLHVVGCAAAQVAVPARRRQLSGPSAGSTRSISWSLPSTGSAPVASALETRESGHQTTSSSAPRGVGLRGNVLRCRPPGSPRRCPSARPPG